MTGSTTGSTPGHKDVLDVGQSCTRRAASTRQTTYDVDPHARRPFGRRRPVSTANSSGRRTRRTATLRADEPSDTANRQTDETDETDETERMAKLEASPSKTDMTIRTRPRVRIGTRSRVTRRQHSRLQVGVRRGATNTAPLTHMPSRPDWKRPAWLFSARANVSNQSAISAKPSSRAVFAKPGYISVYS